VSKDQVPRWDQEEDQVGTHVLSLSGLVSRQKLLKMLIRDPSSHVGMANQHFWLQNL
jgi:hypothetical protein